ncbi:MAG TPA: hypothetical protein VGF23_07015 [Gaiellaceae bacterium]
MAETKQTEQTEATTSEESGEKQKLSSKDLLSRLADAGEEAIQRLGDVPGGERLLNAANSMRNSIDDLSKRVRGLEKLETRIAELERRVDELSGTKTAAKQTEPKPPATTS